MSVRNDPGTIVAALDSLPSGDASTLAALVEPFLDDAAVFVDARLVDLGLSESVLTAIEKYLACHFVTLKYPRVSSATHDNVTEELQRDETVTEYLKIAAALDPTGTVASAFLPDASGNAVGLVARVGPGFAADAV